MSEWDLIPLNDSLPTFLAGPEMLRNNLDYEFNHLQVLCLLDTTLQRVRSASRRYNMKDLDWPGFRARCDELSQDLLPRLELGVDPRLIYDGFLLGGSFALEACGAYRPSSLCGKRKAQLLWWNSV